MTVKLVTMPTEAIILCTIPMVLGPSFVSPDLFPIVLTSRKVDMTAEVILYDSNSITPCSSAIQNIFRCVMQFLQQNSINIIRAIESEDRNSWLAGHLNLLFHALADLANRVGMWQNTE